MTKAQSLIFSFSVIDRRWPLRRRMAVPDGLFRQVSMAWQEKKRTALRVRNRGFGASARFTPGASYEKLTTSRFSFEESANESKAAGDAHDVKISRSCGHRRCDLCEPRFRTSFLRHVRCRHQDDGGRHRQRVSVDQSPRLDHVDGCQCRRKAGALGDRAQRTERLGAAGLEA